VASEDQALWASDVVYAGVLKFSQTQDDVPYPQGPCNLDPIDDPVASEHRVFRASKAVHAGVLKCTKTLYNGSYSQATCILGSLEAPVVGEHGVLRVSKAAYAAVLKCTRTLYNNSYSQTTCILGSVGTPTISKNQVSRHRQIMPVSWSSRRHNIMFHILMPHASSALLVSVIDGVRRLLPCLVRAYQYCSSHQEGEITLTSLGLHYG